MNAERMNKILNKIWDEPNEGDYENNVARILGQIYCEILLSGKHDGEYSTWQNDKLTQIQEIFPKEFIKILDNILD